MLQAEPNTGGGGSFQPLTLMIYLPQWGRGP